VAGTCEYGEEPSGSKNAGNFLISSFRRVQNVVCFLLGDSPASDLYMPTPAFEDGTDTVFRNVGIYKSDAGESPKRKQTTGIS